MVQDYLSHMACSQTPISCRIAGPVPHVVETQNNYEWVTDLRSLAPSLFLFPFNTLRIMDQRGLGGAAFFPNTQ